MYALITAIGTILNLCGFLCKLYDFSRLKKRYLGKKFYQNQFNVYFHKDQHSVLNQLFPTLIRPEHAFYFLLSETKVKITPRTFDFSVTAALVGALPNAFIFSWKVYVCCSKGCTAADYVPLLPGTGVMTDFSVFEKSLRASNWELCTETWHFTVSTRGQTHKRNSTKPSQNLCEWRKSWSSWKILSLLLHTDRYLHQSPQTYLSHVLWSGKQLGVRALCALRLESCSAAKRGFQTS